MKLPAPPLYALALPLVSLACLENEEEITVRPDGSVRVTVTAEGDLADLAEGYAVPLAAPWLPASDDAREWLARVGPATGGAQTLGRVEEAHALGDDTSRKLKLAVERDFAAVSELPTSYADPRDPYAAAYLQRSTKLETIRRDARTVYVFERTFHARPYGRWLFERMMEEDSDANEELFDKVADGTISEDEWQRAAQIVLEWHAPLAREFVLKAFRGHYERGSATIPAASVRAVLAGLERHLQEVFSVERLKVFTGNPDADDAMLWMGIWNDFRDAIRTGIGNELARSGLPREEQYAIQFDLEREFTEYDHTADLGDEAFGISVTLPGEIVTGNFDSAGGGTARWEFDGTELFTGDVTLRAISVLE